MADDIEKLNLKGTEYKFLDNFILGNLPSDEVAYLGDFFYNLWRKIIDLEDAVTAEENYRENNKPYLTFERTSTTPVIIKWPKNSSSSNVKTIYYRLENSSSWTVISSNTINTITLSGNNYKVCFKGDNVDYSGMKNFTDAIASGFPSKGAFKISGNIMSLISSTNFTSSSISLPSNGVFESIFAGMNVTDASKLDLPCNTLTLSCYRYMFKDCTSLTSAPKLSATILANYCYAYMFQGCSSLTEAPYLPATTLAGNCYEGMFYACINLTNVYPLYAKVLETECYYRMFEKCVSLRVAPKIYATTLNYYSCEKMFYNCHDLYFINWIGEIDDWGYYALENFTGGEVETSSNEYYISRFNGQNLSPDDIGIFVNICDNEFESGYNGIPDGWTEYKSTGGPLIIDPIYEEGNGTSTTVNITKNSGVSALVGRISYGVNDNGSGLTNMSNNGISIDLNVNDTLLIFNIRLTGSEADIYSNTDVAHYYLQNQIYKQNIIININTNKTLYGKDGNKFNVMGNIKVIRYYLNSTKQNENFAPTLFAYSTVVDASKLYLKSGTLDSNKDTYCYYKMFYDCPYLRTAPDLSATTLVNKCYFYMFAVCTSLNYVKCLATNISATDCTGSWLWNVALRGTFVKNTNMSSWTSGIDGIPSGWTVQNA